ncbi:TIGR04028 family ABC transporter substrate-binding protein [Brevibacterium casei]|uniref:ABC transporter substrate binding protein n=2 Tax=Brevibacterium casei TaxID=33889 RepID=A0A269ZCC3_9MICO|nr:TIGR04028 family ABC transporter substrate-binding protein [Brevibacterium casei]PAK95444.1 ABC transporter substrate binding protein [Brevibacterium casei]QPR39450.1 TIGR04028 family ABC transporter substrate-binding protein [Brevibacterium casei]QPR43615.1 TIGR04028 family ABC transporter substrate-binding protein [Brevibacterium casei]QPS35111.1 TIGR04028 family ABC transporter substrate-binding protein [Brevibacterium casei]SMX80986.1 peptide/nickel transport system substrate-binding pr
MTVPTPTETRSPASARAIRTRRSILGVGLGLGTFITLSACTPTDTDPLTDGAPVTGGVLTYFEPQTWTLLYPPSVGFYPNGGIMNNISARLLWQDPETLELYPWLATELPEVNADATQYTFTLRDGVTYSDGSPLTPANVAKNFDLFGRGDEARTLPVSEQISNYERSEVLDDRRVRFHFSAPSPGFAQATSTMNAGLLADSTLDLDAEGFGPGGATKIHTAGPFRITAETIGTKLSVRAREDYDWAPPHLKHQGRPYLDGIDYLVNNEYSVRIGAVLSGQADGVRDVQAPDETRVEEQGLRLYAKATNGINNSINFRFRTDLLSDIRVRQALIAAIDRQEIVDKLFTPNYPLATGLLAKGAMGYKDQSGSWVYDPAEAARLLDEAGWVLGENGYRVKDGQVLALTVNTALPQPRSNEVQTLIQQQLRRVGVRLSINPGDQAKQTLDALEVDRIQIYHSMVARADYDNLRSNYSSVNRDVFLNAPGRDDAADDTVDPEIDRLLEELASEPETTKRQAAAEAVQDYLVDQAYVLPFFEEPQVFAFRRRVHGFTTEPVGRPDFYSTWIAS